MSDSANPLPRQQREQRHWHINLKLTTTLLALWFLVSFGVSYFARELNAVFFGWPFSFWVAAQGALIVYVVLVWLYSRTMNRIDHEQGVAEDD